MADVDPTITPLPTFESRGVNIYTWTPLVAANTTGTPIEVPGLSDRTVQIIGTFDSATVVIQGSNDGTNWATLTDPQGNAISKTAAAIEMISEVTRYIRPSISGGSGSESLTVILLAKRVR